MTLAGRVVNFFLNFEKLTFEFFFNSNNFFILRRNKISISDLVCLYTYIPLSYQWKFLYLYFMKLIENAASSSFLIKKFNWKFKKYKLASWHLQHFWLASTVNFSLHMQKVNLNIHQISDRYLISFQNQKIIYTSNQNLIHVDF